MRPYRSMLFVPGHKTDWVDKALAAGPDALILDLEDSVPAEFKADARAVVAESVRRVRRDGSAVGLWVRVNSWESRLAGADLEEVVVDGLDGVMVPKIYTERDVVRIETLLTHVELRNGVPEGTVEILPLLETAQAMAVCEKIAAASPRVAALLGVTAKDADTARALGYQFTAEGLETLYLRSRIVLASRAAGLDHPLCGLWQDIGDIDGLTRFAAQNRQLGYRGQILIHPSHVAPVNAVFTPSAAEVAFYRGMVEAYERAEAAGHAAVEYEGQHVDHAHVATARELLALAESLGG